MIFLLFTLPGTISRAAGPFENFVRLVENDRGLTAVRKNEWLAVIGKYFDGRRLSFDYSRLVYGILSEAHFNGVDLNTAGRVALESAVAVDNGGPLEEVAEMSLFAFTATLTSENIRFYAGVLKKCKLAGIPVPIVWEMISISKTGNWPEKTFATIMDGLVQASGKSADLEKIALFMIISVAQNLGSPEQIVRDAIADADRRAREKLQEAPKAPASAPYGPDRQAAIDFEAFRNSVESFLGTPYFWGGNSRRGVDCSGFTKLVMQENGYLIPRVSRDQAKVGSPVSMGELQLGDLVFFDTKNEGWINHVGLYLGGNLLAHASSSKGVTIVLFSDRYFQSRYIEGRRIVRYIRK
ncbi:MAG: C40 family peptidase [Thermodesulfobacteriota bacterium]